MRTATVRLDGEDRLLCFSSGVMEDIYDKFGGLQELFDAMSGETGNPIRAIVWALDRMMDAGAKYAARKGIQAAPPLTEDDLREVCDLSDFTGLRMAVLNTITAGSEREVEAEPPKNGTATPAEIKVL